MPTIHHAIAVRVRVLWSLVLGILCLIAMNGEALGLERSALGLKLCEGLSKEVNGEAGSPFVVQSFYQADKGTRLDPMLRNAGFTYDNALAAIALFACGENEKATQVADALVLAVYRDRTYRDGRVRNAYRSGTVTIGKEAILLPGFWDAASNSWIEDDYQVGSATGNVAWAALALLTAYERIGDQRYLDAAARVMRWIDLNAAATSGPGYTGGVFGNETSQQKLEWKSTEQNLDVYAAADWLNRSGAAGDWQRMRDLAGGFLDDMWDANAGFFHIGSLPDSNAPNLNQSGIDAELWPVIAVPEFRGRTEKIFDWIDRRYQVAGGYDFNEDRDGVWLEGTAQAALVFHLAGREARAETLFATIASQIGPDGLVYATIGPELSTGLKVGPDQTSADFKYYHLPHIGATAWAILASHGWNPFLGKIGLPLREHPLTSGRP